MGRELKRVAMDFDYPLNKVWEGYLNPHYKPCPHCEGGSTPARVRLMDIVSLLLISGEDSLKGKNHPYFDHITKQVYGFNSIPSPDMAMLTEGLAGRKMAGPFGHDACDRWSATDKIIKAAGLKKNWGYCTKCKGDGIDPTFKKKYNAWKKQDPPSGDGYQLWTTTTEGSPISPVFKSLEALCEYASTNCTTFGYSTATKEEWMNMLGDGGAVVARQGNVLFI